MKSPHEIPSRDVVQERRCRHDLRRARPEGLRLSLSLEEQALLNRRERWLRRVAQRTRPAARRARVGLAGACARGQSLFGYPNIIDVSDETNPKIIAKFMLELSDPPIVCRQPMKPRRIPPEPRPGRTCRPRRETNYSEERCEGDRVLEAAGRADGSPSLLR
jgi:hypothetical protein